MEAANKGLHLLKKRQKGIWLLFGKIGIVTLILVLKFLTVFAMFAWFEDYILHYYGGNVLIAVLMVLYLLNRDMEPTIRTTWIVVILFMPIFGTLLYWYLQLEVGHRLLAKLLRRSLETEKSQFLQNQQVMQALREKDPGAYRLCRYVSDHGHGRAYQNSEATYLPLGESLLQKILTELEKAEKFIYLEYFVISEGQMWGQILEVLARKAQQGVDVRVLYDGACEFVLLPKDYPKRLKKLGIQCKVFSPFTLFLSTHYNYRDHRKILVIDGHTAFNGGINLSDEYINVNSHFGHWKDTAVMVKGEAAHGFGRMFLQMWNLTEKEPLDLPPGMPMEISADGYVMPFFDDPLDRVMTGHRVYSDLLNRGTEHIRIMTPYLILDHGMEDTICYAAQRGVTVQLLLPGIPDKYLPYALAKTHYKRLLDAGVEIYEYSPGFVHGKMVSVDGREAVVGTINFDYRSFCHHFECGTYLYGAGCIADIEADFDVCLQRSRLVSYDTIQKEAWHRKLIGYLLKGFSPLL